MTTLPIDAHIPQFVEMLAHQSIVLLKAEPGAGKTTRIPPAAMAEVNGQVLVVEPRRLAAKLSAERIASELNEPVGKRIGYATRYDRKSSSSTRVLFVTEGLMMRILENSPELEGVDCVILDEFHERNIQSDLALMLLRRLQLASRPDLKLVIMSATLPTLQLQNYLGVAGKKATLESDGRVFPVTVEYQNHEAKAIDERVICQAVLEMSKDPRCQGHILVFLVGIGQIMAVAQRLSALLKDGWQVTPLAADLPAKDQAKAFAESPLRKIILSTNVAETSVTIPGVTGVIDPGFAKIPAHAPWSGLPTLEVQQISQDSAIQRAGRAGRTRDGVVYRLYSENSFLKRSSYSLPDIKRLDFTPYLLQLLALCKGQPIDTLPWFEAPSDAALEAAFRTLGYLQAVEQTGMITQIGFKMARLPLHPRLARIAIEAEGTALLYPALVGVAIINEGALVRNPGDFCKRDDDMIWQIDAYINGPQKEDSIPAHFWDQRRKQAIAQLIRQMQRWFDFEFAPKGLPLNRSQLAKIFLSGYPDRVAKRRVIKRKGGGGKKKVRVRDDLYNFCLGRGGSIDRASVMKKPDWLIAIEAQEHHGKNAALGTTVRIGMELKKEDLLIDPGGLLHQSIEESKPNEAFLLTTYGELEVGREAVEADRQWHEEELIQWLAGNWELVFGGQLVLDIYHQRRDLINKHSQIELPEFRGEFFQILCACVVEGKKTPKELQGIDLKEQIDFQLTYEEQQQLNQLAPIDVALKNNRRFIVHYSQQEEPWIEGYIQEFFGFGTLPGLINGKVPLTVKLLAPNKRLYQQTRDLMGFFENLYPEAMKELSRRYPRHHWPEDPYSASPVLLKRQL